MQILSRLGVILTSPIDYTFKVLVVLALGVLAGCAGGGDSDSSYDSWGGRETGTNIEVKSSVQGSIVEIQDGTTVPVPQYTICDQSGNCSTTDSLGKFTLEASSVDGNVILVGEEGELVDLGTDSGNGFLVTLGLEKNSNGQDVLVLIDSNKENFSGSDEDPISDSENSDEENGKDKKGKGPAKDDSKQKPAQTLPPEDLDSDLAVVSDPDAAPTPDVVGVVDNVQAAPSESNPAPSDKTDGKDSVMPEPSIDLEDSSNPTPIVDGGSPGSVVSSGPGSSSGTSGSR